MRVLEKKRNNLEEKRRGYNKLTKKNPQKDQRNTYKRTKEKKLKGKGNVI